jgi:Uma2 family endonuclease
MAVAPMIPRISTDEYLTAGYHPDVEYVDGVLVERDVPTISHSLMQAILSEYFRKHRRQLRFAALSEPRTQIVERARYRIPDSYVMSDTSSSRQNRRLSPLGCHRDFVAG